MIRVFFTGAGQRETLESNLETSRAKTSSNNGAKSFGFNACDLAKDVALAAFGN
jgi:hypothetical protein